MTEQINQIITRSDDDHFFLQSIYNDTDANAEPVAGNSYYVGYRCQGAENAAPLAGEQPGQVYAAGGIASINNVTTDTQP